MKWFLCVFEPRAQSWQPTAFHQHGRGRLVDDCAYYVERGKAAVVVAAVVPQGMWEVQVAVDARGNPLILLDVDETWKKHKHVPWMQGAGNPFNLESALRITHDKKHVSLDLKNCCAAWLVQLQKQPLGTAEEPKQIWKEMPQSVSMYRQTSASYLAHKKPLFVLRVSGYTTVKAIKSTSQLRRPLLIGVLFTTGQKKKGFSLDLRDLGILEILDFINTGAVNCKVYCLNRLVPSSSLLLCAAKHRTDCWKRP